MNYNVTVNGKVYSVTVEKIGLLPPRLRLPLLPPLRLPPLWPPVRPR